MAGLRFLDIARPFVSWIPEVELPYENWGFDEKLIYSFFTAAIYLILSLPIYGVKSSEVVDPVPHLRSALGSEKGTLLELGLLPVITSAFILQLLAGWKVFKVNFDLVSDRILFQTLQKITSVVISIVYAVLLTFCDYFTPGVSTDNVLWSQFLIILQIVVVNFLVTLLVEVIDKDYGFSSGALLLLAVYSATNFVFGTIGLSTVNTSRSNESIGALIQLFRNLSSKPIGVAIYDSFYRVNLPNLTQFYLGIAIICVCLFLNNARYEVPIKPNKVRAMASAYPIKLLFNGSLPLLYTWTVLYNLNLIGFFVFKLTNFSLLGNFKVDPFGNNYYEITSGLLYLLTPTFNAEAGLLPNVAKPFVFIAFYVGVSTFFARSWSNINGSSGKDIAKFFKAQGISLLGKRDASVSKEFNTLVPVASASGAFLLSFPVAVAELLGGSGVPTSIGIGLLSGLAILETVLQEWQQSGGASQFSQYFQTS
ncbi:hypothetical protein LJB42_001755 [Komagataella kurtzmanii]|nr:hypothetical protein LJB42_001755 [Komagataella kurtzmanii]